MYLTIGTLQNKIKNLTLTVREFNERILYNFYKQLSKTDFTELRSERQNLK
jgi:hypothetical protein